MDSGSLIAARLNINPLVAFSVTAGLVFLILCFWLFNKLFTKYRQTLEYAEKNKDRPSSKKDITAIARKASLTDEETLMLMEICERNKIPNIIFAIKDCDIIESWLLEHFKIISRIGNEITKKRLFSIRTKLLSIISKEIVLKNSRAIPLQTTLVFTPSQGIHHSFTIVNSNQEELWLELPHELTQDEKPEILSKVKVNFEYTNRTPYEMENRVIRYQKDKNNKDILICAQTDSITPLQKRSHQRLNLNIPCKFASVKTEVTSEGKKSKTEYKPGEKYYDGILAEVSGGGCKILTSLPIKPEQYLIVNGWLDGKADATAIGKIVRTTKNKKNEFSLHVKFVSIDDVTYNRINAAACGYSI